MCCGQSSRRRGGAGDREPKGDPPLWPCLGEPGEPGSEEASPLGRCLRFSRGQRQHLGQWSEHHKPHGPGLLPAPSPGHLPEGGCERCGQVPDPFLQRGQVCLQGRLGGGLCPPWGLGHDGGGQGVGAPGSRRAPARPAAPPSACLAPWSWLWLLWAEPGLSPPLLTLHPQDLFKAFARHLSHSLAQKPSPGRSGEYLGHPAGGPGGPAGRRPALTLAHPTLVKEEAQHLIRQFFRGRARCESEADWHGLCDPQR